MLARQALKWKKPVFIDIKGYYSKKEIPGAVGYFGDFVVIDPTDKNRNVAAAVSSENLARFIRLCRVFVRKPSAKLFLKEPEGFRNRVLKSSRGFKLFTITMPRPDVVDDVLWGQLHKMVNQLKEHLSDFSPKAILADDSSNEITLAIILEKDKLGEKELLARWSHLSCQDIYGVANRNAPENGITPAIERKDVFLWEDNIPVSMAAKTRPTENGITVSLVYTPPEFRREGMLRPV